MTGQFSEAKVGDFAISYPSHWEVRVQETRSFLICLDPPGVLCCTFERVQDTTSLPNLSRMLAGYLTRNGHPVATDELLRMSGSPGLEGFSWQYKEHSVFYRLWLYGNEKAWILLTFNTPEGDEGLFQQILNSMVRSLRFEPENEQED